MANQPMNDPKDFNLALRLLETTGLAHADTFNPLFQRLINNDAYLNSELSKTNSKIDDIEIPVTSVNNKTGTVSLTAGGVGAETPSGAQSKANGAKSRAKSCVNDKLSVYLAKLKIECHKQGYKSRDWTITFNNAYSSSPVAVVTAESKTSFAQGPVTYITSISSTG